MRRALILALAVIVSGCATPHPSPNVISRRVEVPQACFYRPQKGKRVPVRPYFFRGGIVEVVTDAKPCVIEKRAMRIVIMDQQGQMGWYPADMLKAVK